MFCRNDDQNITRMIKQGDVIVWAVDIAIMPCAILIMQLELYLWTKVMAFIVINYIDTIDITPS